MSTVNLSSPLNYHYSGMQQQELEKSQYLGCPLKKIDVFVCMLEEELDNLDIVVAIPVDFLSNEDPKVNMWEMLDEAVAPLLKTT